MDYETSESRNYEGQSIALGSSLFGTVFLTPLADEGRGYDRDRSRSPRDETNGDGDVRARSASPIPRNGNEDRYVALHSITIALTMAAELKIRKSARTTTKAQSTLARTSS